MNAVETTLVYGSHGGLFHCINHQGGLYPYSSGWSQTHSPGWSRHYSPRWSLSQFARVGETIINIHQGGLFDHMEIALMNRFDTTLVNGVETTLVNGFDTTLVNAGKDRPSEWSLLAITNMYF